MSKLTSRPRVGSLVVPFMVDQRPPIDFKSLSVENIDRCAKRGLCGVCGGKIRRGPVAFIGPDDGRDCFGDPWMHLECALLAMVQCPFLAARRGWREAPKPGDLIERYERNMVLYTATAWSAHRDKRGAFHFQATRGLTKVGAAA